MENGDVGDVGDVDDRILMICLLFYFIFSFSFFLFSAFLVSDIYYRSSLRGMYAM